MTHWKTEANKSHKKRHIKANRMTKKEERAFFGHGFGPLPSFNPQGLTHAQEEQEVDSWFD